MRLHKIACIHFLHWFNYL